MKSVIFIKLGGSSITDKKTPYTIHEKNIRNFAREIKKIESKYTIIISHGSGSFGHVSASKFGGKKGYKSKIGIATVSSDARRINQIVTDTFVEEGVPVVSLSPMSMILSDSGKLSSNFFNVVSEVMEQGLIPLVYGDVIWDKKWKSTIFSGERTIFELVSYLMSKGYKIKKVIQVVETNGVYDLDGKTLNKIDSTNINKIGKVFTQNDRIDVTGGMKHKVEVSYDMAKKTGVSTLIISGSKLGNLTLALDDKSIEGTLVSA